MAPQPNNEYAQNRVGFPVAICEIKINYNYFVEGYIGSLSRWVQWLERDDNATLFLIWKIIEENIERRERGAWEAASELPTSIELRDALDRSKVRREDIYLDDEDRMAWLEVFGDVCARFNWVVHAYCQMTNHYHLVVETVDGNLSKGMRQLNGIYTQRFNRRHGMVGHLFQGRYKAILVQKETYLLELTRYVVLNSAKSRHGRKTGSLALE